MPKTAIPTDAMLKTIREVCLKVARRTPRTYPRKSPLAGYCVEVSYVAISVFGGSMVAGLVQGEPHYWNRLPGGREVDLTSCQFGGDGFTPHRRGKRVKRPELVEPGALMFAVEVLKELGRE